MCTRDEVRAAVRSFNKGEFTTADLQDKLPHLKPDWISGAIFKMLEGSEVAVVGMRPSKLRGRLKVMREVKLKEKYRPTIQRNELDLKGWRKVFPELFIDPRIPGQVRFVDNGLRQ